MTIHKAKHIFGVVELALLLSIVGTESNGRRKLAIENTLRRITHGREQLSGKTRIHAIVRFSVKKVARVVCLVQMVKTGSAYVVEQKNVLNGLHGAVEIIRRAGEQGIIRAGAISSEIRRNAQLVRKIDGILVGNGTNGISVIIHVHVNREIDLAHVIDAGRFPGSRLGAAENRKQQRRKNRNDGNDHQQLN